MPDTEVLNAAVASSSPRLAYLRLIHLADEVGRGHEVSDPQASQGLCLRERPEDHEVRVPLEKRHRGLSSELVVGLVEDDDPVARLAEPLEIGPRQDGPGRVDRLRCEK